ncbi:MAG: hypothetical protein IKI29_01935 [Clostridia bacterium]|nr:hypothetical protein [Clostridia bacterium]
MTYLLFGACFLLLVIVFAAVGFIAGFFFGNGKKYAVGTTPTGPHAVTRQKTNIFGLKDWEYRNFMRYDGTENQEFDAENGDKE